MTKIILSFVLILVSNFGFFNKEKAITEDITICHQAVEDINTSNTADTTLAYSMPLLAKTAKNEIMLSWTEKDAKGMTSFCLAFSKDNGKTFSEKKTIFSGNGIGNSRMMRAKVLAKKDGTLVAIFSNRDNAASGKRSANIVYCESKDNGTTWTAPVSVDSDPTTGIMRGFFDAAVLANDEIAVVYLKDVANSKKHEERDLRLVTTKNGVFQAERVIDPVVCDCCPVNLLVDANGALNVLYRDNNDDIRDMAKMISTDNAQTFSKPAIIHQDNWKIQGCPHSGAVSATAEKGVLVAYFSGSEKEKGIRLISNEGKKLVVLDEATAKNPYLVEANKNSILLWEQNDAADSKIVYRKVSNNKVSEIAWLKESTNATNSVALAIDNQVLVAYEVKNINKRNSLKISTISL